MPRPCVLIVDDYEDTRFTIALLFRFRGWSVLTAATLREGLSLLESRPDCVLIDLALSDGDGEDLLRKIRDEALPVRIAAVVTGIGDTRRLDAVSRLRPDVTFMKPVDPGVLLRVCSDAMGTRPIGAS